MTSVVGVELGPEVIRAVSLDGWRRRRVRTFELYWDPANPTEAVEALRESLGSVERLAVTVDLSFLFAKQVRLPAVPAAEKRRIMMLEPERFFPIRGEDLVLAVRGEDNLVFAARSSELGKWIEALETIAPVELVEPGPVSLARALGRTTPQASTVLMEDKNEGVGIAEMEAGRVRRMRRVRRDPAELSAALASLSEANGEVYLRPLNGNPDWRPDGTPTASEPPSVPGLRPSHLSAYGATLGLGGDLGEAMLTPDLSRRIVGRRRRSVVLAAIACALAFGFAVL